MASVNGHRPTTESVADALDSAGLEPLVDPTSRAIASKCPLCLPRTDPDYYPLTVALGLDGTVRIACLNRCEERAVRAALPPAVVNGASAIARLRTRGVLLERVKPIRWLWARRIPCSFPSLLIGDEGVGKGTLAAWLIAKATRGELDGDLKGKPIRVLVVGDEDGFDSIWVPRLFLAGADLGMVVTLDEGEYLDDLRKRADDLRGTIEEEGIGMVLLDQLLDHVNGGRDGQAVYNPKNVREALMPLRRVVGEKNIAAVALLHPTKGKPGSFRDLIAGSHQFNAISRSSLLLGEDPDDESRRILVRGKGNHSAAPRSFEFRIAAEAFELNGHSFEMPKVTDEREGERTVRDLMGSTTKAQERPVRETLAEQLLEVLTDEPKTLAQLARAVGRDPKDGSVRNALKTLAEEEGAERCKRGTWRRVQPPRARVQSATPYGGVALAPSEASLPKAPGEEDCVGPGAAPHPTTSSLDAQIIAERFGDWQPYDKRANQLAANDDERKDLA